MSGGGGPVTGVRLMILGGMGGWMGTYLDVPLRVKCQISQGFSRILRRRFGRRIATREAEWLFWRQHEALGRWSSSGKSMFLELGSSWTVDG